jgi:hypothetical protein
MAGNAAPPLGPEQACELGHDAAAAGQGLIFQFMRPKRDDARQLLAPIVVRNVRDVISAVARRSARASGVRHVCSVV